MLVGIQGVASGGKGKSGAEIGGRRTAGAGRGGMGYYCRLTHRADKGRVFVAYGLGDIPKGQLHG